MEGFFFITLLYFLAPLHEAFAIRTLPILLHITASAIAGTGIYYGASGGFKGWVKMIALITLATGIHALWNYVAFMIS